MNFPSLQPMKKIRENCLSCAGGQAAAVRFCPVTDCPLWYLRFGRGPEALINEKRAGAKELLDPQNFEEGGKFDPATDV